jgi:hypothetical protein
MEAYRIVAVLAASCLLAGSRQWCCLDRRTCERIPRPFLAAL